MERRTKIVATLGPATSTEEMVRKLVHIGVDVTRLNFSHGEHEGHLKNARFVRAAAEALDRNVAVMQDIQGPKIRIGEVVGETELIEGNRLAIAPGDFLGDASRLSTSYEQIAHDIEPGHRILKDDGLLELRVEEIGPPVTTTHSISLSSTSSTLSSRRPSSRSRRCPGSTSWMTCL